MPYNFFFYYCRWKKWARNFDLGRMKFSNQNDDILCKIEIGIWKENLLIMNGMCCSRLKITDYCMWCAHPAIYCTSFWQMNKVSLLEKKQFVFNTIRHWKISTLNTLRMSTLLSTFDGFSSKKRKRKKIHNICYSKYIQLRN